MTQLMILVRAPKMREELKMRMERVLWISDFWFFEG
jgi:hypothetical protein